MYDEFDDFLKFSTWHTRHPNDEERFNKILHKVVKAPGFDPDQMGQHMRKMVGASRDDEDHAFNFAINDYVATAWAIKEYLRANGV